SPRVSPHTPHHPHPPTHTHRDCNVMESHTSTLSQYTHTTTRPNISNIITPNWFKIHSSSLSLSLSLALSLSLSLSLFLSVHPTHVSPLLVVVWGGFSDAVVGL